MWKVCHGSVARKIPGRQAATEAWQGKYPVGRLPRKRGEENTQSAGCHGSVARKIPGRQAATEAWQGKYPVDRLPRMRGKVLTDDGNDFLM